MRVNPKYNNICAMQIGMNRKDPCYDCLKISECDQHYDESTGEWDYPDISKHVVKKPAPVIDRFKRKAKGVPSVCRANARRRQTLIDKGLLKVVPITTTLEEAIRISGIDTMSDVDSCQI